MQEMQSLQDEEILHLGTDDYRESLVLLTPDGHASKFMCEHQICIATSYAALHAVYLIQTFLVNMD